MAIVSHREAVDGVWAPPRVQRVEQLCSEAVVAVPQSRNEREVVCPHVQLAGQTLERETLSAIGRDFSYTLRELWGVLAFIMSAAGRRQLPPRGTPTVW